jgi:hypothetical protein
VPPGREERKLLHHKNITDCRGLSATAASRNLVRTPDELYEFEKRLWVSEHPEATPAEYSAAMLAIARRCGV